MGIYPSKHVLLEFLIAEKTESGKCCDKGSFKGEATSDLEMGDQRQLRK